MRVGESGAARREQRNIFVGAVHVNGKHTHGCLHPKTKVGAAALGLRKTFKKANYTQCANLNSLNEILKKGRF